MYYYSATENSFFPEVLFLRYKSAGKWPDDAIEVTDDEWQTYGLGQPPAGMQRGADENGRPCWVDLPPAPIADLAAKKRHEIEQARKADEAEGITLNSVRYSGSPENRQSLADALDLADEEALEAFKPWKDSDDVFHPSVPVADIRSARSQIMKRRAELIAKEDAKYQEIDAAVKADDRDALNAIAW